MTSEPRVEELPRWGFASPGTLRDDLTRRALAGRKTATAALLAEYEAEGAPLPHRGSRQVLVGSAEQPVAVVETTGIGVVRLADVDDAHAIDEGEGFLDATAFRAAHERFWTAGIEELRRRLGDRRFTISDDTPVVAERFRVVEVLGPDPGAGITVRPVMPADRSVVDAFLANLGAALVARRGELVDARLHPALIAEVDGALAGVATWIAGDGSIELLTLHASDPRHGAGSALIAAARTLAGAVGVRRLWLITTNDNLDALRFYQRCGFRLARLHSGAVDRSRARLKPSIPAIGDHGIPIRDEIELDLWLGPDRPAAGATEPDLETLELALARRDEAAIPGGYPAVLAVDFVEHGQSGRRWSRDETLAMLADAARPEALAIERFAVDVLADEIALVTYDLVAEPGGHVPRLSRRSSVWVRRDGRWQLRFHQGTSAPAGPG